MRARKANEGISRVGLVVEATVVEKVGRRRSLKRALDKDWDGTPDAPVLGMKQGRGPWAEPKKSWESRVLEKPHGWW